MLEIFAILSGALFNRLRGGLLDYIPRNSKLLSIFHKIGGRGLYLLGFALLMCVSQAQLMYVNNVGSPVYNIDIAYVFLVTSCLWLGSMPGLGRYVGALGGWENKALKEFKPIDNATRWLANKFKFMPLEQTAGGEAGEDVYFKYSPKWKLRAYGFVALGLRGALWGGIIAIPLHSIYPFIAGLTMPVIYLFSIELARVVYKNEGKGWPIAEYIFGATLWCSAVL